MNNSEQKKAPGEQAGSKLNVAGATKPNNPERSSTVEEDYNNPPEDSRPFPEDIEYFDRSHGRNQAEAIGATGNALIFREDDAPMDPFTEAEAIGKVLARDTEERCLYLIEHGLIHSKTHKDLLKAIRQFISENGRWNEVLFAVQGDYPEGWGRTSVFNLKDLYGDHEGNGKADTWEPTLEILRDVTRRRALHQLANQIQAYSRAKRSGEAFDELEYAFRRLEEVETRFFKPDECLIQDGAAFCKKEIQKAPVLVDGILKQGSKMVLGGGSKSFKTWTLLNMGLSVAYGVPFWEHETKEGRVLYVDMELDEEDLQYRKNRIMRAMRIPEAQPGKFDVLPLKKQLSAWRRKRKQGIKVDPFDEIVKIISRTRKEYALIILDPLYKFLGSRNENDAGDMADLFADIELLSDDTGAAVIVGAHFSKGNQAMKEAMDRISGSGVFARDPDSVMVMTPLDEKQGDCSFQIEARLRKFKPLKKFAVRWEEPLMVRDDTLDPDDLKGKAGRKAEYSASDLKSVLPSDGSGMKREDWKNQAEEKLGIKPTRFAELLNELMENEEVSKKKEGRFTMYSAVYL